jgi:hypothetical protein
MAPTSSSLKFVAVAGPEGVAMFHSPFKSRKRESLIVPPRPQIRNKSLQAKTTETIGLDSYQTTSHKKSAKISLQWISAKSQQVLDPTRRPSIGPKLG